MVEALFITLLSFVLASALYARFPSPWTNPVGLSVLALVTYVMVTPLSLETYQEGTKPLVFLLRPTVVALGWLIYREWRRLTPLVVPLLSGIMAGTLTSLLVTPLVARFLGAGEALQRALAIKSVTSAVAVDLAVNLNTDPALSVPLIILTGIFGAALAVPLLRLLGIREPLILGLSLGASSHGIGTTRAVEEGVVAAAMSGVAMSLMGLSTALLAPWAFQLLGLV